MGDLVDDKATWRWLSSLSSKSSEAAESNQTGSSCPRRSVAKRGFLSSMTKQIGSGSGRRQSNSDEVLSVSEFVLAGDNLVSKCPTWEAGDLSKRKPYLPSEKQFLITGMVK